MRWIVAATVSASIASTASAQTSQVPEPSSAVQQMRQIVVSPNTEVVVTPNDNVTTKGSQVKEGFKFPISTVFDVMQDGYIVIPKGTRGEGTVTWMTNKGAFGKSGKMEVSFNWLELNGRRVSLTGNFRQEGEGNTGATVGAVVAVGVFGGFVTGRSATIVNGQQLRARTAEPLTFLIPDTAPRIITGTLAPVPTATAIQLPTAVAAPANNPVPSN
jgi:hypothetical protein